VQRLYALQPIKGLHSWKLIVFIRSESGGMSEFFKPLNCKNIFFMFKLVSELFNAFQMFRLTQAFPTDLKGLADH